MKSIKIVAYLLVSITILIAVLLNIMLYLSDKEVEDIKSEMIKKSERINISFDDSYIKSLPIPVQRYFAFSFKDKKTFSLKAVEWEEEGKFKLPKLGEFSMNSWQYSLMNDTHYLWRGYMGQYFGLLTIESMDYFTSTSHNMRANIWGIKKIMHSDYIRKVEINSLYEYLTLRYYGTALNFPWILFSNKNIKWEALDKNRAYLNINVTNERAKFIVSFKEDGRVWKMETINYNLHGNYENLIETSYKDEYINWQGVMVPSKIKYIWRDKKDNITAYEFKIKKLKMIK